MVFVTLKKDLWIRIVGDEDYDLCVEGGSVIYLDNDDEKEVRAHIRNWENAKELIISGAMVRRKREKKRLIRKVIDSIKDNIIKP